MSMPKLPFSKTFKWKKKLNIENNKILMVLLNFVCLYILQTKANKMDSQNLPSNTLLQWHTLNAILFILKTNFYLTNLNKGCVHEPHKFIF